jgi:hypothetical protein
MALLGLEGALKHYDYYCLPLVTTLIVKYGTSQFAACPVQARAPMCCQTQAHPWMHCAWTSFQQATKLHDWHSA